MHGAQDVALVVCSLRSSDCVWESPRRSKMRYSLYESSEHDNQNIPELNCPRPNNFQLALNPPSRLRTVLFAYSFLTKNITASATSSAFPYRRRGMSATSFRLCASEKFSIICVSIYPGTTAFARNGGNAGNLSLMATASSASVLVKAVRPALLVE